LVFNCQQNTSVHYLHLLSSTVQLAYIMDSTVEDHKPYEVPEKPIEPVVSNAYGTSESLQDVQSALGANLMLVDETIEAIGFGRFQWQLTLSCGFGFLADQVRSTT
jgi:hypothetical protein